MLILGFQLLYEEVLTHNTLLDTITAKSASITENYVTQLELQDLQERYNTVKDNAMVITQHIWPVLESYAEFQFQCYSLIQKNQPKDVCKRMLFLIKNYKWDSSVG